MAVTLNETPSGNRLHIGLLVPVSSSIRQDLMMKENWVHYE